MQRFLKPHHLLTKWLTAAPAWLTAHHVHCVHHSAHSQHHRQHQFGSWHTWMEGALLSVLARTLKNAELFLSLFTACSSYIAYLAYLYSPVSIDYLLQICQVWSLSLRGCGTHKSKAPLSLVEGGGSELYITNLYLQLNNTNLWQFLGDVINQAPFDASIASIHTINYGGGTLTHLHPLFWPCLTQTLKCKPGSGNGMSTRSGVESCVDIPLGRGWCSSRPKCMKPAQSNQCFGCL